MRYTPTFIKMNHIQSLFYLSILFLNLNITGCALNHTESTELPGIEERRFGVHKVKSEKETPSMIAAWYTNSPKNWVKFFVLKKQSIPGPYLPLGSEVYIPSEIIVQRLLMTPEFSDNWKPDKISSKKRAKNNSRPVKSKGENTPDSIDDGKENIDESLNEEQLIENLIRIE